jgi:hypothetical protein
MVDHQGDIVIELGWLMLTAHKIVGGGRALLEIELFGVLVIGVALFQFVLGMGADVLSFSLLGKTLLS